MKLNIFKILNEALGNVSPSEFMLLYYVLNGMRMSHSLKLKVPRDVILDAIGAMTARNLSKSAAGLASKGYLEVEKNKNNIYCFVLCSQAIKERREPQTRKEDYYQQLEHPLWQKKRNVILDRDHHQCVLCGSDCNLQVHHLRYSPGKKAWEYPNAALVTLCKDCHEKVHKNLNHELNPYKK